MSARDERDTTTEGDDTVDGDDNDTTTGGDDTVDSDDNETTTDGDDATVRADATDGEGPDATVRRALREVETGRWDGMAGVALALVGTGIVLRQPGLVLVGAIGVGYGLYTRVGEAREATLEVTRTVSDEAPEPGDEVTVTVRARNVGEAALPDLRLVDGVPPGLAVVDGPARIATALRPGAAATFEYAVRASRGEHEWEAMRALTRDAAGSRERTTELETATRIVCTPELAAGGDLPLRGLTTTYHGRVATDVGGSGVEFYATREYRRGDPIKRIDWNRRARTGELATLELREERAATVVLLIDTREPAYAATEPEADTAVESSVEAAGQAFTALLDGGDRVGIATLGPLDCWLPPGAGTAHAARGRKTLATDPALAPTPSEGRFYRSLWFRRFRRRLPADAQVLLFTPLVDDVPAALARRIDAYGHLVTVLSPDVTAGDTHGDRLIRFERRERLRELRSAGIRAVEWGGRSDRDERGDRDERDERTERGDRAERNERTERSFPVAVAAATRRWSR